MLRQVTDPTGVYYTAEFNVSTMGSPLVASFASTEPVDVQAVIVITLDEGKYVSHVTVPKSGGVDLNAQSVSRLLADTSAELLLR